MRHRGHVIIHEKAEGENPERWMKHYVAYNAHPEWMMPILEAHPTDCAAQARACRTGISQFDGDSKTNWGRLVGEYHDHKNFDIYKHPTLPYPTLDEALLACTFENIYVWDGFVWSHRTISVEAKEAAKPARRPKKNVWREMRKLHESKESGEVVETPVVEDPVSE